MAEQPDMREVTLCGWQGTPACRDGVVDGWSCVRLGWRWLEGGVFYLLRLLSLLCFNYKATFIFRCWWFKARRKTLRQRVCVYTWMKYASLI